MRKLLFTAGPVEVRDEVLDAMRRPLIVHRGKEYRTLHTSIMEKLHRLLNTDNGILMFVTSATGAMEAAVRSGVSRSIAHVTCGAFGERWVEISKSNGKETSVVSVPWGEAVTPPVVEKVPFDSIEAVAVTHNETSTGVMNPVHEIAETVRERGSPLLFVDAVTSAFAVDLNIKAMEPDFLLFGTQKALALPPGLAFAVVSQRYLEKAKTVQGRGKYLDVLEIKDFGDRQLSPATPPISLMYALDLQLERIQREGMRARAERHLRLAEMAREWARHRLALFPAGYFSNTVTCVRNLRGMEFELINSGLGERGFQISEGYGKLKGETFRIGHMGDFTIGEMEGLLKALDEVFEFDKNTDN
ncbi:MAG: alanine--glyoxylate aminotransferase family protein [Methanomassiliicoccales archaeon]